ncbi:MAG: tRNA preQ1(34) S-adenosylmethionine ribosyltransferase-isomerase QueA [Phycisphaerae bacterium]|nr:tRNA preQ1(34) S-adenosylmethionine ribosyltransferase-isomerase QueA [Phycisphaerae bacterium]
MRTRALDYELPESLIATRAAEPRDSARLMVVSRRGEAEPTHARVADLPGYLRPGDLLVFNTTRVIPARLVGRRRDSSGRIEGLFLSEDPTHPGRWVLLVRAKRAKTGVVLDLYTPNDSIGASLRLIEPAGDEPGAWAAELLDPIAPTLDILARVGRTPLPPYILKARRAAGIEVGDAQDRERYQTVYAGRSTGSVAAPTAGLHFTPMLLERVAALGVERADVVLHVGPGTFRPVETEYLEQHHMHAEHCEISPEAWTRITGARRQGRRVIAVGTTTARTLESYALHLEGQVASSGPSQPASFGGAGPAPLSAAHPGSVNTSLLIAPGYRWRVVDGLLTNFHLPRSTLLAMVGALFDAGLPRLITLYRSAVERAYRFYSYGDAMLVLPD